MISDRTSRSIASSDGPRKSPKLSKSFDATDGCVAVASHLEAMMAPQIDSVSEPSTEELSTSLSQAFVQLSILLVDDTFVNCTILLKIFGYASSQAKIIRDTHRAGAGLLPDTDNGISVCLANDGSTALEYVNVNNLVFDYVISDYNMPNTNGDELIKALHKSSRCGKEFILMTGAQQQEIEKIELSFIHDGITNFSIFQRSNNAALLEKARSIAVQITKEIESKKLK